MVRVGPKNTELPYSCGKAFFVSPLFAIVASFCFHILKQDQRIDTHLHPFESSLCVRVCGLSASMIL